LSEPAQLVLEEDRMSVIGEVDFASVVSLEPQGEHWLRERAPADCRLDFSGLSRCNSAVMALLLSWLRTARAIDKNLAIENIPEGLRGQMHLAGLEDILAFA